MRTPRLPLLPAAVLICCSAPLAFAEEITLSITDPQPRNEIFYSWSDSSIWDADVPGAGDSVIMPLQTGAGGPVDVTVQADSDITIGSLELNHGVEVVATTKNFAVTGDTEAYGFLTVTRATMSLGNNLLYDAATKTLNSGQCLVGDDGTDDLSILEWAGADIEINKGGFNLFGANVQVRDQNTGISAFQNLKRNDGFLVLDDGFELPISGNFTNGGNASITLNLNPSPRTPKLEIAGNFQNDGLVELFGNTVLNVSGGLSGSGRIVINGAQNQVSIVGAYNQTGGSVNLGGSGVDSFILKAQAQIYSGGATITGSGTLEGTQITITSGTLQPGSSPGEITVKGNLTLEDEAVVEVEIGGRTAGTGFDRVRQIDGTTGIALDGELKVTVIGPFFDEILSTDEFEVVTSEHPLQGEFSNAANGQRLTTADGRGSFLVSYGATGVKLSDFQVNPESFSAWLERYNVPTAQRGPLDDPNGDGVKNLEAYVRGMAPVGAATLPSQLAKMVGNQCVVELSVSRTATGVDTATWVSGNLTDWTPGPTATVAPGTAARETLLIELPIGEGLPRFARFSFIEQVILAH